MAVTQEPENRERIVDSRTGVAVVSALLLANIANYGFQVIAGRGLTVAEYGSLGGYMAAITVITVSTSALQMMAARTVASGESDVTRHEFLDGLTRSALIAGIIAGLVVAAISPVVDRVLDFGIIPTILLGIYVFPAALDSIAAGRLQGSQRFTALATYSSSQAFAKLVAVVLALAIGATVTGLLGAIVISSAVVAFAGRRASARAGAIDAHVLSSESRRAFAAVTLFWVILSMDVPIAHALFDDRAAGIYAAGAVLGKAVLWIPITVAQLVFPALAGRSSRGDAATSVFTRAALLTASIAAVSVATLIVFGDPIYGVLYGDRYAGAGDIAWRIGLAMIPMSIVNLAMFHHLARRDARFVGVFAVCAGLLALALFLVPARASAFAATLAAAGIVLLAGLLLLGRWRGSRSTAPGDAAA